MPTSSNVASTRRNSWRPFKACYRNEAMSSPLHVLIADDSPTIRQMLTSVINATPDMRVIGEATSGAQAVKLARTLQPNVILMDLVMPEMDGLEATREIMSE